MSSPRPGPALPRGSTIWRSTPRHRTGWTALHQRLSGYEPRIRIFYLATSPDLFGPICRNIKDAGLVTPEGRVVLEKPLGHDLESSFKINDQVGEVFPEDRIFRIDHYLGKETVQNLMALRFANSLFEPLWNSGAIDHVQITVAESSGIGGRGAYYDRAGAAARHGAKSPDPIALLGRHGAASLAR